MQPLSEMTTLGLGGPPRRVVDAGTEESLVAAVRESDAAGEPVLVLGGGSNLVVADEGFPGAVVRVLGAGVERDGDRITAQAGESWDALVQRSVSDGLADNVCRSSTSPSKYSLAGGWHPPAAENATSV